MTRHERPETPAVRAAPLARVPALAWLMAHAYARSRPRAVLAYPIALATTLTYALRGGVYESDDQNGMVIVARWRFGLDMLTLTSVMVLGLLALAPVAVLASLVHPLLGPATYVLAGATTVAGALVLAQGQETATPIARNTPTTGDRWQIAALAQRPGTRLSAMLLTRRVIGSVVPPGDVLVVSAVTADLEQAYIRAGFTPLGRKRLYKIA